MFGIDVIKHVQEMLSGYGSKDHQVWGSRDLVGGANLGPSVLRNKI